MFRHARGPWETGNNAGPTPPAQDVGVDPGAAHGHTDPQGHIDLPRFFFSPARIIKREGWRVLGGGRSGRVRRGATRRCAAAPPSTTLHLTPAARQGVPDRASISRRRVSRRALGAPMRSPHRARTLATRSVPAAQTAGGERGAGGRGAAAADSSPPRHFFIGYPCARCMRPPHKGRGPLLLLGVASACHLPLAAVHAAAGPSGSAAGGPAVELWGHRPYEGGGVRGCYCGIGRPTRGAGWTPRNAPRSGRALWGAPGGCGAVGLLGVACGQAPGACILRLSSTSAGSTGGGMDLCAEVERARRGPATGSGEARGRAPGAEKPGAAR